MALYLYSGNETKVHAGGYVFKPGKAVEVNVDALTEQNKAQLAQHGIKPAPAAIKADTAKTPVHPEGKK